jgi:hypothetical protein
MGATNMVPEGAAAAIAAVAAARQHGEEAQLTLFFQAGQTTLGPVALGPAPRVF